MLIFVVFAAVVLSRQTPAAPERPRVEYTEGIVLGVDVPSPRFSWTLLAKGMYFLSSFSKKGRDFAQVLLRKLANDKDLVHTSEEMNTLLEHHL